MLQPEREHKREPCGQDVSAPRSPPAVLLHGLVRERPSTRHETTLYRNHGLSRRDEDQPSSSPLATHLSHLRGRVDQVPHVTVEFIFPPVSRGIAGSTNHKAVGETVWNRDKVRVSRKRNSGSCLPGFTWVVCWQETEVSVCCGVHETPQTSSGQTAPPCGHPSPPSPRRPGTNQM